MKLGMLAVFVGQGDIKNVVKRGGHQACSHATALTNRMAIQVAFGNFSSQHISSIVFQCSALYQTEFDLP